MIISLELLTLLNIVIFTRFDLKIYKTSKKAMPFDILPMAAEPGIENADLLKRNLSEH